MEAENKNKKKIYQKCLWAIGIILLVLFLLSLLRSCGSEPVKPEGGSNEPVIEAPIGDFEVTDEQQLIEEEIAAAADDRTITFAGYGRYEVSEKNPNVELRNPAINFVDMVFTLSDKDSGEIIARTAKVTAGNYVYVNVLNHYKVPGTYNVEVAISTYDSQSGAQMNGMDQQMELVIK